MRAICVDDEPLLSERIAKLCRALKEIDEAYPFTRAEAALQWLESNEADLALLDIDMPDMNGIDMAKIMKLRHPNMKIVFLTSFPQYALDAIHLHVSGYLLKPVDPDELAREVDYAFCDQIGKKVEPPVRVTTFGGFEVFVSGKQVDFRLSKSKELLALLVDRRGISLTRAEAFATLWEDRLYDRSMQKQFDVIIRSLRETLRGHGIEAIFEMKKGRLRICPERIDCDLYHFFDGDVDAFNAYRGEYMNAYSWANLSEGALYRQRWPQSR